MTKSLETTLENLKEEFLELLPSMITALVVLLVGYILARIIKYLAVRSIKYVGGLLKDRFGTGNFEQAASFIGIAFFWLIIFISLVLITDILGLGVLIVWFQEILQYLPNILAAILIVFAAILIGDFISGAIVSLTSRTGLTYGTVLARIAKYLILFTAAIIAIDQIGIEISFLVNIVDIILAAMLFAAALAFGLGARTSVSNILATFYVRKMYKIGDHIQIGEINGRITKIDSSHIYLESDDGQVVIPSKEFNEVKSFLKKIG